jgi:hypothetical protein
MNLLETPAHDAGVSAFATTLQNKQNQNEKKITREEQ